LKVILKPVGGAEIRTETMLSCTPAKGDIVNIKDLIGGVGYKSRVQRVVPRSEKEAVVTPSKWF
jgi:hypothetical protein